MTILLIRRAAKRLLILKAREMHLRQPTAEVGNYKKIYMKHHGLEITGENPIGTIREGGDDAGDQQ